MTDWVVVASRDHADAAVAGGFVQAGHGRHSAVARFAMGDRVVVYSPREAMRGGAVVQSFTARGRIADDAPYQVTRESGATHSRRTVRWVKSARPADIRPLLDRLSFTNGKRNWGMAFRRGLFAIDAADYDIIAGAMPSR